MAARAEQERSDHAVALRLQAEYEPLAPSAPLAQQEDTAEPQNKDSAPPSLDETAAPEFVFCSYYIGAHCSVYY